MKSASMADVAARAGVSLATVSLVLSGKGRISEKTRTFVLDAVDELSYEVNRSARSLRTSKTSSVGVYVPSYGGTLDFYMELVFGVTEAAREDDFSVVLVAPHQAETRLASIPVDGFIVVDVESNDPVARTILGGVRPVIAGEAVPDSIPAPTGTVEFDHYGCTRRMLDHLWERGARHIAAVTPRVDVEWAIQIERAYADWCTERDVTSLAVPVTWLMSASEIVSLTADTLVRYPEIDAIVTFPDASAPGVLRGITQSGRAVGTDVLVASYFDGPFASWMSPTITAFDFQPREFGRQLFESLKTVLDSPDSGGRRQIIDADRIPLVERESTIGYADRRTGEVG